MGEASKIVVERQKNKVLRERVAGDLTQGLETYIFHSHRNISSTKNRCHAPSFLISIPH